MVRFAAILCIALAVPALGVPVIAQDTPAATNKPAPQAPPPPAGQLTGTVICDDTHRPARGAAVVAMPLARGKEGGGRERSGRVGMDGTYLIRGLAPGEYGLIVLFPGYPSTVEAITMDIGDDYEDTNKAMENGLMANGTVVVKSNATARLDQVLHRGAAVSGRVMYDDGSPAAMLNITLESTSIKLNTTPGHITVNAGALFGGLTNQSRTTDDKGHFRITNLSPGTYRLAAAQPFASDSLFEVDSSASLFSNLSDPNGLRVYVGNTLHASQARPVELKAGEELSDVEIIVPLNALHTVSGQVLSSNGRSANTGRIVLTDDDDPAFFLSASIEENGSFRLSGIPNGTYTLSARNAGISESGDFLPKFVDSMRPSTLPPATPFKDGNQAVIVKDVDLADVHVSLIEMPRVQKPATLPEPNPATEPSIPPQ